MDWSRLLGFFIACLVVGCGSSHSPGDGSADGTSGSCIGPAPTGCIIYREPGGSCCDRGPGTCVDGEWRCETESSSGMSCEGPCGTEVCSSGPPTCHLDLGDGCCGGEVPAVCLTPIYSCPSGSVERSECTAFSPECGGTSTCDSLTEAECIGDPGCAPLYDDFCCPTCIPIGACADCSRIQMYRCAPVDEVCAGGACGMVADPHCSGGVPTCEGANVTTGYRCDQPGCVAALDPSCADDCPLSCVPATAESCMALCDVPPPVCPMGTVPQAEAGCYTGLCIPQSVCVHEPPPP